MNQPPKVIDGARVIAWAWWGETPFDVCGIGDFGYEKTEQACQESTIRSKEPGFCGFKDGMCVKP